MSALQAFQDKIQNKTLEDMNKHFKNARFQPCNYLQARYIILIWMSRASVIPHVPNIIKMPKTVFRDYSRS